MMQHDAPVSVDAAWLCAAERDVERGEEEQLRARARVRKRQIPGKYERETDAVQLDRELNEQRLTWRRKAALRRDRQRESCESGVHLPFLGQLTGAGGSNNNAQGDSSNPGKSIRASVYASENRRLAALVMEKKLPERVCKKKQRPRIVDDMLSLEKRYVKSAQRIQKWWKAFFRRSTCRLFFRKTKAAIQIQRFARGWLTRRWLCVWHNERTLLVTKVQAAFRGFYFRKRVLVTWMQWEYVNAATIQSVMRMYLSRKRCIHRQRMIAAVRIQALWRGRTSRKKSDLVWLSVKAVNLQRLIRGVLAQKQVCKMKTAYHNAATQVQRMFRGMEARKRIAAILLDRETDNRLECMAVLDSEVEWHRIQRDKLQARLARLQLEQEVSALEDEYYREHERITDMESIYLDMKTQRMRISPRAIEHGWVEEMEHKIKIQRRQITETKMALLFGLGLKLKSKEALLLQFRERIEFYEERQQKFEIWREEEFLDYWERECYYRQKQKLLEKRRRIAEQRRRWRVQFYHINGKIDTRWLGNRWSDQVLEEAKSKQVFCIGSVDTLAGIQQKWTKQLAMLNPSNRHDEISKEDAEEERTRKEIDALTEEIAALTANAQIEQTKAIFGPVLEDFAQAFNDVQTKQRVNEQNAVRIRQQKASTKDRGDCSSEPQCRPERDDALGESHGTDRNQKKRQLVLAAKIPWHLLDHLAAEKHKLAEEKALFETWGKISTRARSEL